MGIRPQTRCSDPRHVVVAELLSQLKAVLQQACGICLKEVGASQMHTLGGCAHRYCRPCLGTYVSKLIEERKYPVRCGGLLCPHVYRPFPDPAWRWDASEV